jgi:predicted ATPase
MNKEIYINNFRMFKDFSIELARINILIGENSSGKSSFLKLLLALKQTIEEPGISNLILNGNLVDLGNYKETIYCHEENSSITFGFAFGDELIEFFKTFFYQDIRRDKGKLNKLLGTASKAKTYIKISLNKDLNDHKKIDAKFSNEFIGELDLIVEKENTTIQHNEWLTSKLIYKRKADSETYIFEDIGFDIDAFLSIIYARQLKNSIDEQKIDPLIFYELALLLLNQNLLEEFLKKIIYINPLSSKPQRIYFNKDAQSNYKENNLDKFANLFINNAFSDEEMREFSKILSDFGIADKIKMQTSKKFPVSEIKVQIQNLVSNIYDVGYGVALQVPLIFEAFMSEKKHGNQFLIEQPEVHLHPRLQAKLMDTLLSLGSKNSYIIETHSEHIVRMLQVIVKQKKYKVKSEDINIYYFSRLKKSFDVSKFFILSNGQLNASFPSGFYDNSYNLTKSLLF